MIKKKKTTRIWEVCPHLKGRLDKNVKSFFYSDFCTERFSLGYGWHLRNGSLLRKAFITFCGFGIFQYKRGTTRLASDSKWGFYSMNGWIGRIWWMLWFGWISSQCYLLRQNYKRIVDAYFIVGIQPKNISLDIASMHHSTKWNTICLCLLAVAEVREEIFY